MADFYPGAYKKGKIDFYGREFFVSSDVLIPRPETEQMVDFVLSLFGKQILPGVKPREPRIIVRGSGKSRILDVGTGSGCVGISVKLEIPEAEVILSDISKKALDVARRNAGKMGADVEFLKSDLLKGVEGDFEVILANLPYVDRNWEWLSNPESRGLKFEPETALFAENGGLELIFRLITEARGRAKFLILEADPCQHEEIIEFCEKNGFLFEEKQGFELLFSAK
ncbi:HemK family protein methyltransferase [Candidatus Saccharibacteria bacterium]|nr:HemK family protein methyltransferase [Candidatus Saccharibacteria bacterium]